MKTPGYIAVLAASVLQAASSPTPLVSRQTIELPGVEGRIDHLAVDVTHHRLFVAALGNNTVEVVDLTKATRTRSLTGFHEPQGVVAVPDSNLLAVANGDSGDLVLVDATDGAVGRTVPLSDDADNVRYDPSTKRLFVAHGSGAISAVDLATGKVVGEVRLPGHPESFQLEHRGNRMFANVPAAGIVAVIGRDTMRVEATWPVASARANYPMALDEAGHRLFVGCRRPARVLVYDVTSGRAVASFDTAGDTDDLFFDGARKRLYVSGGEGFLDVFQQQGNGQFARIGHVPTAPGARTSLYVPEENRLFLAVPHRDAQKAEIRVYEARN